MKKLIKKIRRPIVYVFVFFIYCLGCLCYDKQYLAGKYFDRKHYTDGWRWVLRYWFGQKIMGRNRHVPWPVPPHICIANPENIIFDPNDMNNFQTTGNYFQGIGAKVVIGKGTMIAAGTGFITSNHDPDNVHLSLPGKDIVMGEECWIGMNAVILPGVQLGPHTIVGAGSVVTKSFTEGNCVIAGNPAKLIRKL